MLHDLAVVGAGPVGATLALAVADSDFDVVVLDARARGETLRGERSLALSHGARLILERLGVWTPLAATAGGVTPITTIDVSQARGFGSTTLRAAENDVPALGYVVSYRALQAALDSALARTGVAVRHGANVAAVVGTTAYAAIDIATEGEPLLARLAAIADGAGAVAGVARRRHDYRQVALVAQVWRDAPHDGCAYERFTADGPVALLPQNDHYGLVWTMTPERAQTMLAASDAAFLAALERHFGTRAGRFVSVAERRAFPLVLEFATASTGMRTVAVGNAAQTLHPVAGQGFNVGLRDAFELARIVVDTPREALGARPMLERFVHTRRADRWAGIAFTHGLVQLFGLDAAFVRLPRGLALTLLDALPPAKRAFTRAMLFGIR